MRSSLLAGLRLATPDRVLQDIIVWYVPVDGNAVNLEVKGLECSIVCEPGSIEVRSRSNAQTSGRAEANRGRIVARACRIIESFCAPSPVQLLCQHNDAVAVKEQGVLGVAGLRLGIPDHLGVRRRQRARQECQTLHSTLLFCCHRRGSLGHNATCEGEEP